MSVNFREMIITIRKSVNDKIRGKAPELVARAIEWLKDLYPTVDFERVDLILSESCRRSRYYRNERHVKYTCPVARICTRPTLYLYNMKTLKIKELSLFVGREVQTMSAIVHELTHHAQYELKKPTGELETTRNELNFIKEVAPKYFARIMDLSDSEKYGT